MQGFYFIIEVAIYWDFDNFMFNCSTMYSIDSLLAVIQGSVGLNWVLWGSSFVK